MTYFKKFTDFCTGFAAFSVLMYLFCEFMAYSPRDKEGELLGAKEKLGLFFDTAKVSKDYRVLLLLILLLLLSITVACLARKLPALSFVTSLLPLSFALTLYADGKLYEHAVLLLLLLILSPIGALYDCLSQDREDTRHRAHLAINLSCILGAFGVLFVYFTAENFAPTPMKKFNYFDQKLYESYLLKEEYSILWQLALLFLLTVLLSFLLRELYFLDAIIALIPAGWILVRYATDGLPVCGELLLTLALVNLLTRIAIMLFGLPNAGKKRKDEQK